ncbi:MAG: hypothetical protein L0332_07175 [Chloroflexi bacterium]|nr:hypothetical protein [Chloroflexota bacterium]MCI0726491.1 hypothetical protein [Chloroflexota bacterium]
MGGRGGIGPGSAPPYFSPAALEALSYTITSFTGRLGGATFPFLEQTGRAWHILTRPVDEPAAPTRRIPLAWPSLRYAGSTAARSATCTWTA